MKKRSYQRYSDYVAKRHGGSSKRLTSRRVEYCVDESGRMLSECQSLMAEAPELAKPNGNDVSAWRRFDGQSVKVHRGPTLYVVFRSADYGRIRKVARMNRIKLGEPFLAEGYVRCLACPIESDNGIAFNGNSLVIDLWNNVPKFALKS
jgi:hypothetical protein